MLGGMYLVQVPCSAGFGTFLLVSALAFHWLEDCANFTPKLGENNPFQPTTLIAIQAASQSTFINALLYSTFD